MPLVIQASEISDRLRRFLGVRGRVPIGLDETMVAMVLEADLSQAPYRQEGLSGDMHVAKGAVAAEFSYIFWGPALAACTLIVDRLIITNVNATTQLLQIGYQDTVGGVAQPTTAFSGEQRTDGASPPVGRCAWGMDSGDDALELIGLEVTRAQVPALSSLVLEGPWTIQPSQNMVAKFSVVNVAITVAVKARQFQLVER